MQTPQAVRRCLSVQQMETYPTKDNQGQCKKGQRIGDGRAMPFVSQVQAVELGPLKTPGLHGQRNALTAMHQV